MLLMQLIILISMCTIASTTFDAINMDLEDLKRYSHPAQSGRKDMIYVTLQASQVGQYLETMTCTDQNNLYLTVDTRLSEETSPQIELTYLYRCHLSEVWIESIGFNAYLSVSYRPAENSIKLLGVTQLHIVGPFYDWSISELIADMPQLEFLELRNNIKMQGIGAIVDSLRGKPVKVLKLNGIQGAGLNELAAIQPKVLFKALEDSPLVYLELCNNRAQDLYGGLFDVAPHLRILNISHNRLFTRGNFAEIFLNPFLEVIDVSYQGEPIHWLHKRSVQSTINTNQTRAMATMDEELSEDDLTAICSSSNYNNSSHLSRCILLKCAYFKLLKLDFIFNLSCNVLPDFTELTFNFNCNPPVMLPILRNVKTLVINSVHSYPWVIRSTKSTPQINCFAKNSLEKLSFNHNKFLVRLNRLTLTGNDLTVTGFEALTELDLSFNMFRIDLLNSSLLKSFPDLHTLYIQGNNVSINQDKGKSLCDIYPKLKHIDLSFNDLYEVSLGLVKSCKGSLHTINLSSNKVQEFQSASDNTPPSVVTMINFSDNNIRTFTETTQAALRQLKPVNGDRTGLEFTNNPFICDCSEESLKTIEILQSSADGNIVFHNRQNYTCFGTFDTSGQRQFIMEISLENFKAACFPNKLIKPLLATTTCSLVVIVSCAAILLYKYRFHIYTMYFKLRHRSSGKGAGNKSFKYDAFISYCSEDRFWVHDVLMKTLEETYKLELCIHLRDFLVGEAIDDEIVRHMADSRNHIIIFSDNYLKKTWPVFELQVAYREHVEQKKKLVVIKFGKISTNELSGLAKELWDSRVYLEWPENEHGQVEKRTLEKMKRLFWDRLVFRIYGHEYPCYMREFLCCCKKKVLPDIIEPLDDANIPLVLYGDN